MPFKPRGRAVIPRRERLYRVLTELAVYIMDLQHRTVGLHLLEAWLLPLPEGKYAI